MSNDRVETSLNITESSADGRREPLDEDSSTQNNDAAEVMPRTGNGTVPQSESFNHPDLFLGAGLCQSPTLPGAPAENLAGQNTQNGCTNETSYAVGYHQNYSLLGSEIDRNVRSYPEVGNTYAGRFRQVGVGMMPIAEDSVQIHEGYANCFTNLPPNGNLSHEWVSGNAALGSLTMQGDSPQELISGHYANSMQPFNSVVSDFPQSPFYSKDSGTHSALPANQQRAHQMSTGIQFHNSAPASSVRDMSLTGESDTHLMQAPMLDRTSSSYSMQSAWRNKFRRERILQLSQNPLGPNTILATHSVPEHLPSWEIDNMCYADSNIHNSFMQPCMVPPYQTLFAKYHSRPGIIRRFRRRFFSVGGRVCRNFFIWVLLVATLAGIEGFKQKSDSLTKDKAVNLNGVQWSDSEEDADSERAQNANVDMHACSFEG